MSNTDLPVCVSLGPGEPDLITLKALKTLQASDLIYCPATQMKGSRLSRSCDILTALEIPMSKIALFDVPMSKERSSAEEVYLQVAQQILTKYQEGVRIAFVAEGDSGFYSSAHYIADYLAQQGVAISYVAGVPAFIACGAVAGLHVVKQDESLRVYPSGVTCAAIESSISAGETVVVMKLSQQAEAVREAMQHLPYAHFHYFENIGYGDREYYTNDRKEIESRTFPYFAIMIIRAN